MQPEIQLVFDVVCEPTDKLHPSDSMQCAKDSIALFRAYRAMMNLPESKEAFIAMYLNSEHKCIALQTITIGLVNTSLVHPREVFRAAIALNAVGVVCCHNHPTSNVNPSPDDDNVTERLTEAGNIIGIPLLDHVIIGKKTHNKYYAYSMCSIGYLEV